MASIREQLRAVLRKNIEYGYHFISCSFLGDYIQDEDIFRGWYEKDQEKLINESIKEIEKIQQESVTHPKKEGLEIIQSIHQDVDGQQFRDSKLLHLRPSRSLEGNGRRTLETQ